eukprot:5405850-Alexandrium_andersonii.AAC.1
MRPPGVRIAGRPVSQVFAFGLTLLVACGCLLGARVAGLAMSGVLEIGLLGWCARPTLGRRLASAWPKLSPLRS